MSLVSVILVLLILLALAGVAVVLVLWSSSKVVDVNPQEIERLFEGEVGADWNGTERRRGIERRTGSDRRSGSDRRRLEV
jgi:flagellar basal body-associated protein FliL